MEKPFKCSTCGKHYVNLGNLTRHNQAVHRPNMTKFQCWHCPNTYKRKESARKHCLKVHGDIQQQTLKLPCQNPNWKPEITKPGPWIPPPEARPKKLSTIYKINIQDNRSQINKIKERKRTSRLSTYIAITPDEALMTLTEEKSTIGRLLRLQTLQDLSITPSSSTETITQDETSKNEELPTIQTVYGIFPSVI